MTCVIVLCKNLCKSLELLFNINKDSLLMHNYAEQPNVFGNRAIHYLMLKNGSSMLLCRELFMTSLAKLHLSNCCYCEKQTNKHSFICDIL